MIEVRQTAEYANWFRKLRDPNAKARINTRLRRVTMGNLGDHKTFGAIGEIRIDYGPGYRVYFTRRGKTIVFLLCGGDKRNQSADIAKAKEMERNLE